MNIFAAKKIYMIGIKGVGMTMLAQFLSEQGIEIITADTELTRARTHCRGSKNHENISAFSRIQGEVGDAHSVVDVVTDGLSLPVGIGIRVVRARRIPPPVAFGIDQEAAAIP